ncbi:Uncharacterized protein YjiP, partial [Exaiptasia diaphana]
HMSNESKQEHDASYKSFFSHKAMVEPLIRRLVAESWVEQLDFSTLQPVKTHFVGPQNRKRDSDLIWRVKLRQREEWLYVYLLMEFQSTPSDFMALRMLTYICLLYEDLVKQRRLSPSKKLPPVLPIVLYNGSAPWTKPVEVSELVDPADGLDAFTPRFRYYLIDEGRVPQELLEPVDDPVAALLKLERAKTQDDLIKGIEAMLKVTSASGSEQLRSDMLKWLRRNVLPFRYPGQALPEAHHLLEKPQMLAETVKMWPKEWLAQGRAEGRVEGRVEGRAEGRTEGRTEGKAEGLAEGHRVSIFDVCSLRGLELTQEQRRVIEEANDHAQLRAWLSKAIQADTADEIFA